MRKQVLLNKTDPLSFRIQHLNFLNSLPSCSFSKRYLASPECRLKFCPWPLKGRHGPMNSCMQATEVLAVTPVPRILRAPTATSSFARNVWLGCLYVFHGTNRRDLQRSTDLCACLPQYMKSRRLVERTVPKTRRFELVSRCFTWDPNPRSSHQHPNVASCYSGGVGELQAKAKDILRKIKGALLFVCSDVVIFAISAVSCLTWWIHMLSCWASGPQTSCWGWRHHCTTTQQNKQLASLAKLKPWDL